MSNDNKPQERLREKAAETRDNIADIGHLAKETVQEKYQEMKELAADKYSAGKQKLADMETSFEDTVRETPMKSVLIAAGVGLLLGILWRRR